jgi:hypothetical protein
MLSIPFPHVLYFRCLPAEGGSEARAGPAGTSLAACRPAFVFVL